MLKQMKATAFLAVAALLLYGIIQIGDGGPEQGEEENDDNRVRLSLQIEFVADNVIDSINIAISADLGSAGHYAKQSQKIYNALKYLDGSKDFHHEFTVRRGERVTAELANITRPVTMLICAFFQEDVNVPEDGHMGSVEGFGDITTNHQNGVGQQGARCAAVAH